MTSQTNNSAGKCPVMHGSNTTKDGKGKTTDDWWPEQLNLKILHQHSDDSNPHRKNFDYKKAFLSLNLDEVKSDIEALLTDSKPWWPADYGHYGPFMIRLAWHAAGTYRTADGRGGANTGNQRFPPLNSWPDNINLDKARRLLWPIKQKYGNSLSWADLFVLVGNVAIQSMGLKVLGFGGGREDIWEAEEDIYWGPEDEWEGNARYSGDRDLEQPLAAVQMGLIYVNPEGPDGNPDPKASAVDIRETFKRMGMNDYETVALSAGGHTFGKGHGAGDPKHVGPEPEAAPLEQQGLGWKSSHGKGFGRDTISNGIEGSWTPDPIKWDHSYFDVLLNYDWELTKSPAGAQIWHAKGLKEQDHAPDVEDDSIKLDIMMTTADLAFKEDPDYRKISEHFHKNPKEFEQAFNEAWFKLMHRDMGPKSRYLGDDYPKEDFVWQDPIPKSPYRPLSPTDIAKLKDKILASTIEPSALIYTAWSSASTFRKTDYRGGANGARIRLEPQISWEVNQPEQCKRVLRALEEIQSDFNDADGKGVSLSDLIVLAGNTAVEQACSKAGVDIQVAFSSGRADASQEQTDIDSFEYLEPQADGFRNYCKADYSVPVEELLIDKAHLLGLSAPEMTVLLGGMRTLDVNYNQTKHGVLTDSPGTLSPDFFITLTNPDIVWEEVSDQKGIYYGKNRDTSEKQYSASRVDMAFGANSRLRALTEFYAQRDNKSQFYEDFARVWAKVMNADMF